MSVEVTDWDSQIEYLHTSQSLYYNDDYLEFLVGTVWKITSPVHILDFGCGFEHLGLRLLPLLKEGSTYTGIDSGEKLIEHARQIFSKLPYEATFIEGDFYSVPIHMQYDVVVCHAVLLHMVEPMHLLQKMRSCVKPGGMLIAFEPHWNSNMAGYHFEGIDHSSVIPLGSLQELFERDAKRTGRDGNIGIKLPLLLHELGLKDVQCRVSDKVNILNPNDPAADRKWQAKLYEAMKFHEPGNRESFLARLMKRGMLLKDAERQYEAEKLLSTAFTSSVSAIYAPHMKMTFGTV
ncbi:SAM-dependent methyltransferase [Brevibacillus nitrificans]|nr:SAM-dependent methyltransferase [Brevibacillus nitrificans]